MSVLVDREQSLNRDSLINLGLFNDGLNDCLSHFLDLDFFLSLNNHVADFLNMNVDLVNNGVNLIVNNVPVN